MPPPPISALIDAPRQSNFRLRASLFAAIITTAATPNSHPDCRALLIKIVALYKTSQERVAAFLLEMNGRMKEPGCMALPMSRRDIADYLGLTIETVSRALSEFKRKGYLKFRRRAGSTASRSVRERQMRARQELRG